LRVLFGAEQRVQIGHRVLLCILRVQQQQPGLGKFDVGKALVECGLELGVGESADLVRRGLAGGNGLLGNKEHGLAGERLVKRLIDGQHNVFRGRALGVQRCLGLVFRALHQVMRLAEVGDQLAHGESAGRAIVDAGIVEQPGGDARPVARVDGRQAACRGGQLCRACLARDLGLRELQQFGHADAGIMRNGHLLRISQR
jgi:hypothetical protein